MVEKLTSQFLEEGLLDDQGYVRGMVNSLRRQGKSRQAIFAKLQSKRVPTETIETALNSFDEDNFEDTREAELISALKVARKRKLGPYDTTNRYEFDKALSILARQGFSFDTSRSVLEKTRQEAEELQFKNYM